MDIPAGQVPFRELQPGEAARIMTGAYVPDGADAVVPVEKTDSIWHVDDSTALPEQVEIKGVWLLYVLEKQVLI
jgi:molybdopterin molybdotransferase